MQAEEGAVSTPTRQYLEQSRVPTFHPYLSSLPSQGGQQSAKTPIDTGSGSDGGNFLGVAIYVEGQEWCW